MIISSDLTLGSSYFAYPHHIHMTLYDYETSHMHAHINTYLCMHIHTHRQNRQAQKEAVK